MSKRKNVIVNFFWRLAERVGAQLVSLIVSIVLARLLEPTVFGTVALINVFINILNVFVNCGLSTSLIQKKDADNVDFSTVFFANIIFCSVLYLILFFAAPFIATFYNDDSMTLMIRVISITLLISGVKNVQIAYVTKNLQFKRFFFATLGGTVGAAVIGICMAYFGFGVWALISQSLFNNAVDTLILWLTVKWKPNKTFSLIRFKSLWSFGWKLLASNLLDTVYNNIRSLIIGKKYSSSDLAYYNRGQSFPVLLMDNIHSAINSVLFPSLAKAQGSVKEMKSMMRRSIKTCTYCIAPVLMGFSFISEPFVRLILTEKWLPCVPFLHIFCITYMFYPIHTANLAAINAMGRSDIFLKLEIIKKIVGITALIISMQISVLAMAYSLIFKLNE